MRFAVIVFAGMCLALPVAGEAVHRVRFSVPPIILVWGEAGSPSVSPALTGSLLPDAASPGRADFRVATNTPFEICLSSADGRSLADEDLAQAGFSIVLTGEAPNATGRGGPVSIARDNALCVWQATARTAARPGPPPSQAVAFSAGWNSARLGALTFTVQPLED